MASCWHRAGPQLSPYGEWQDEEEVVVEEVVVEEVVVEELTEEKVIDKEVVEEKEEGEVVEAEEEAFKKIQSKIAF